MANNFEDLECWQRCYELKNFLKKDILPKLPASEKFQLHSQILRASRSSTANIAEGWGRYHYKENIKFLLNARGSVAEILDHSIEAFDCHYIVSENLLEVRSQTTRCLQVINGYIRYLRKENEK